MLPNDIQPTYQPPAVGDPEKKTFTQPIFPMLYQIRSFSTIRHRKPLFQSNCWAVFLRSVKGGFLHFVICNFLFVLGSLVKVRFFSQIYGHRSSFEGPDISCVIYCIMRHLLLYIN